MVEYISLSVFHVGNTSNLLVDHQSVDIQCDTIKNLHLKLTQKVEV